MAPGDAHSCRSWLQLVLAAALLATPTISPRLAAETGPPSARLRTALAMTRFSELTELTPANVGALLALVGRGVSLAPQDGQLEKPPGASFPARAFSGGQAEAIELMSQEHPRAPAVPAAAPVSYLLGSASDSGDAVLPRDVATAPAARELRAWDPIERQVLWSVREALPISPATLVTAGGLVFYGTDDGWLKAVDARTGRMLWSHRVAGRRLDGPRSFRGGDGHQYIAVRALPLATGGDGETLVFALAH